MNYLQNLKGFWRFCHKNWVKTSIFGRQELKPQNPLEPEKNCIFSNVFWDPKILTQSPFWGLSRQGAKGFLLDADVFPFDRRFTCFLLENDLKNLHDLCPSVDQCRLAADFARRQFSRYASILARKRNFAALRLSVKIANRYPPNY